MMVYMRECEEKKNNLFFKKLFVARSVKCEEKENNLFITHIQSPGKFSSKKLLVANVAEVIDIRL